MDLLARLPRPSASRLAVRITPDARRQIRSGHPWVFDGSITSVNRDGTVGDLAVVFDDDRKFVAIGLWDPTSPIRLKVLHSGAPVTIDRAWFRARTASALEQRRPIIDGAPWLDSGAAPGEPHAITDAYRVVNGENDGMPGLVVDRYRDVVVLKLYSAAWFPHLADVVPAIVDVLAPTSLVLRLARNLQAGPLHGVEEAMVLVGEPIDGNVLFTEANLLFDADVIHGQKTGHFLDQRDNRIRVGRLAAGKRVLDVFSCTGGFSVHAAAGGANAVTSIDSSPGAIETAKLNMAYNSGRLSVRACDHVTICGEAFGELEKLVAAKRRFDVIVIDPPSFAQNAASTARALVAYERLTTLAVALLDRDGVLVQSSCSSRVSPAEFYRSVHAAASRAGVDLVEIERTGHAIDHPVTFPEGGYLKTLYARPASPGELTSPFPT